MYVGDLVQGLMMGLGSLLLCLFIIKILKAIFL